MDKEQAAFSFDLNESLHFRQGEEVGDMVSISLEPIITLQQQTDYVQLRGVIELKGEYRRGEEGHAEYIDIDEEDQYAVRHIEEVNEIGENELVFLHHFPIEISIPEERIDDLHNIKVQVATFDYLFPANDRMNLQATVEILGILPEERVQEERDQLELPLPFFGADEAGAQSLEELMNKIASFDDELPQFNFDIVPEQEEPAAELAARETVENIADQAPEAEGNIAGQAQEAEEREDYAESAAQEANAEPEASAYADERQEEKAEAAPTAEAESEARAEEEIERASAEVSNEAEEIAVDQPVAEEEKRADDAVQQQHQEQSREPEANSSAEPKMKTAKRPEEKLAVRDQKEPAAECAVEPESVKETEAVPAAESNAKREESKAPKAAEPKAEAAPEVNESEAVAERGAENEIAEAEAKPVEAASREEANAEADNLSEEGEKQATEHPRRTEAGIHAQQPEEGGADLGNLTDLFGNEKEQSYTSMRLYIVQDRDTIESIADRYEIPVSKLLQHNRLENENIGAGQLIYIPVLREANA